MLNAWPDRAAGPTAECSPERYCVSLSYMAAAAAAGAGTSSREVWDPRTAVPQGPVPIVRSLEEALGWFSDICSRCGGRPFMNRVYRHMQGVTVSTAFSGIGAAEVALGTIERGLATAGMQELSVRSLFAVEINTECQIELQCLATKPDCIYADMVELIAPGIREHMREYGHRLRFDDLVQLAKKPKFATAHASCMIHRNTCTAQRASLHVAGTPCVDYSSSGKRSGILGGTLLPFLAWVGQRRTLQEPAILHENVQQFAPELLDKFLGDMYTIQSCVFNAAVLGHACDRERRLTWMLHKGHVNVSPQNNWPESLPFFVRTCTFTWEAYCVSTAEEREEEIRWAAGRQSIIKIMATDRTTSCSFTWPAWKDMRFAEALTDRELDFLKGYLQLLHSRAGFVVQLNQNPEHHSNYNRSRHRLQTITRNNHMLFSLTFGRWLTLRELLLAQAFPVLDTLGSILGRGGPCSFNVDRKSLGFGARKRNAVSEQVGNSMNVNAIGAAFFWLFGFTDYRARPAREVGGIAERVAKRRKEMQ